jgi:hypothetical protein
MFINKLFFALLLSFFWMNISFAQKTNSIKVHYSLSKELKAGKKYDLPVSITNTLSSENTGTIDFGIINTKTNTSVDGWFLNIFPHQFFTGTPRKKFSTTFPFTIPSDFKGEIKFIIKAECHGAVDSVTFISVVKNNLPQNEK